MGGERERGGGGWEASSWTSVAGADLGRGRAASKQVAQQMEGAVTESEDRLCTTEEVAVKTFLSLPAADGEVSLQDQSILKQECQTRTNRPAWALPAQSHSARVVVGVFVGWGGEERSGGVRD